MDIEKVLDELMKPAVNTKSSNGNKDVTFEMQKLQQQMRQHALKEKKPCTSYFNFSKDTSYNNDVMNDLADKEINVLKTKKGWKGLPKSIQWELLTQYFETEAFKSYAKQEEKSIKADIKKALISNNGSLVVSYDAKLQTITSVTI